MIYITCKVCGRNYQAVIKNGLVYPRKHKEIKQRALTNLGIHYANSFENRSNYCPGCYVGKANEMNEINEGFYRKYSDDGDYVAVVLDDLETVKLYNELQDGSFFEVPEWFIFPVEKEFCAAARAEAIAQAQAACHHDWQLMTSGSIRVSAGEVCDDRDEYVACSRCGKREDV